MPVVCDVVLVTFGDELGLLEHAAISTAHAETVTSAADHRRVTRSTSRSLWRGRHRPGGSAFFDRERRTVRARLGRPGVTAGGA